MKQEIKAPSIPVKEGQDELTKSKIAEAMQIGRYFEKANRQAKIAGKAIVELTSLGAHFISQEDMDILRKADSVIDKIRNASNEWGAMKYANTQLSKTNP